MKPVDPAMFDSELWPTPRAVAGKMLSRVSGDAVHFLEPSAGRGDLAEVIKGNKYDHCNRKVDCIEQAQELVAILASKEFPIVGYDWLDYNGVCYYDAIVMNPPFSNGDKHLLRAWDFMHDGEIVCLLNEETINNPCTESRRLLAQIIKDNGGQVELLGDCFSTSARKTDVRVAMVYLKKTAPDDAPDLWAKDTEEKIPDEDIGSERHMLAIRDRLGNMQHFYDMANSEMLKGFQHIRRASVYLDANGIGNYTPGKNYDAIVGMAMGNMNSARAEFAKKHRRDAWMKVFDLMEFRKWLDKKQTEEFVRDIERNGNIPFTAENIKGTLENVFAQRGKLFEMSVANVFDELIRYHKANHVHHEGWKTNDSYKVNRKLVFPYGCQFDSKYTFNFSMCYRGVIDVYMDLDRVLCVLDGKDFEKCYTIGRMMDAAFRRLGSGVRSPFNNTVESEYFDIRFFKKGTVHLVFKDEKLWEKFNLTAAKGKRWLGENTQDEEPEGSEGTAQRVMFI